MPLLNSIKSIAGSVGTGLNKGITSLGRGTRKVINKAFTAALSPPMGVSIALGYVPPYIADALGNGKIASIFNKLVLNNISRIGTLGMLTTAIPAALIKKGLATCRLTNIHPDFNKRIPKMFSYLVKGFKDPSNYVKQPLSAMY